MLDRSQADVLDDALGVDIDNQWAATEVAVIEPRQNGKGTILEARALAGLFAFHEPLILWTAHEFKTAREGFLRIRSLVENTPHLDRQVRAYRAAAGEEGIELKDGCRLRFIARSGGSGRGFSGSTLFLDEAYALNDDQLAALLPTLSAKPDTQIWYMSSAPLPNSEVLRRICKRGRAGGDGLSYSEWCADKGAALDDRQAWKQANPALGLRINESAILRELGSMGPDEFARERLGIWSEESPEAAFDLELWRAARDPSSTAGDPVAIAVDTTPDRARTAISAAGRRADSRIHGVVIEHEQGTGWVVDRLVGICRQHEPCAVVLDPAGPAGAFIPALEEAGIRTKPGPGETLLDLVSTREAAQACGSLIDLVTNDGFRHLGQPALDAAVAGAKLRTVSDAKLWDRKNSDIDISPLVAVTLAAHGFAVHGVEPTYDVLDSVF